MKKRHEKKRRLFRLGSSGKEFGSGCGSSSPISSRGREKNVTFEGGGGDGLAKRVMGNMKLRIICWNSIGGAAEKAVGDMKLRTVSCN